MIRQDYFKRQVDQLGKVLSKILADLLGKKNSGENGPTAEITSLALKSALGLGIEDMITIPDNDLVNILTQKKDLNREHLETLAEILLNVAEEDKDTVIKQTEIYKKCLVLLEYAEKQDTTFSLERRKKIERLKNYC